MLAKTFEWYRIVNLKPLPQTVDSRTKAAAEFSSAVASQDSMSLFALIKGIVHGFEDSAGERAVIGHVLRTLKQFDPAVSENIQENAMELRSSAATAVGEFLSKSKVRVSRQATLLAAGLLSSSYIRSLPRERFLRIMIEEILGLANEVFEGAAKERRDRTSIQALDEEGLEASNVAELQNIVITLQDQIQQLSRNALIDREEIDVLWFVNAAFSRLKKEPYSSMAASTAAAHIAVDLSGLILMPPYLNVQEIIAALLQRGRPPADLAPQALKTHVQSWKEEDWGYVAPADSRYSSLSNEAPVVFPLTWIANRMRIGKRVPNWSEFGGLTGLRGDMELTPSRLACQVLFERVAASYSGD